MHRVILSLILTLGLIGSPESIADPSTNPLVEQVTGYLREQGKEEPTPEAIVGFLNKYTASLYQNGKYADATKVAEMVRDHANRTLGPEHPLSITGTRNLAVLYYAQGRYDEAEPLFRWALKADERVLGKEHPNTLTSINNLASL